MEILVVEDEVRLAQHISRALTEAGHQPVMVHDGEIALGKAELKRYDLLVLDVMLPGMDGFTLCGELRRRGRRMPGSCSGRWANCVSSANTRA
jgi:DNA-binding response OmpR family regulator